MLEVEDIVQVQITPHIGFVHLYPCLGKAPQTFNRLPEPMDNNTDPGCCSLKRSSGGCLTHSYLGGGGRGTKEIGNSSSGIVFLRRLTPPAVAAQHF